MPKKPKSLWSRVQAGVVVVLVTLLSAVFVLEFGGPQSEGCSARDRITYAARVHGRVITTGDFEAAYALGNFGQYPPETQRSLRLREMVLQGLIERDLLAREARRLGFTVDEEDVWRRLAEEGTAYLSLSVDAPSHLPQGEVPIPVRDEKGSFDTETTKRFIQYYLRRNVGEFAQAQMQELLAERMRQVMRATVSVSPQEVWDAFVQDQERVRMAYVRFTPAHYRESLEPTGAQLQAWMDEHAERLEREYQANKHRYTDLEKQVRARHILVRVGAEDGDEAREAARQKAETLHQRVVGGADFEEVARAESDDPGSGPKGGDLGWNPKGRMVSAFDEAQFSMEPGEISGVVESEFGFHIIRVDGVREGDVPKDEALREIAERLYREEGAEAAAKRAADDALGKLAKGMEPADLDVALGGPRPVEDGETPEDTRGRNAPRVEETHAFARGESPVQGGGDSGALVHQAFQRSEDDPLPEAPVRVGQDYFVFKVLERQRAEREDFTDDEQRRLMNRLVDRKADEAVRLYVQRMVAQAEDEDAVRINPAVLSYGGAAREES
jgi:peptidyl-prolyl cis-trans isomerase D